MTGRHLAQLQAAVIAQQPAVNASLAAASLPALKTMAGEPIHPAARRPLARVTLAGEHPVARPFGGGAYAETVTVTVTLEVDAAEAVVLAYEGVVKATLAGAGATLRAAVADATLSQWELIGGTSEPDSERENADAWAVEIRYLALLQW